jgi:multiple sugar transport system ATP-binding protein
MTILPVRLADGGENAAVTLGNGARIETRVPRASLPSTSALEIGLRPEHVRVSEGGAGDLEAEVVLVERLGERSLVYARLSDGGQITAEDKGTSSLKAGDRTSLTIDGSSAHLFGPDGIGFHGAEA